MDNKDKKIEELENELNIERQKVSKLLDTNITLMMKGLVYVHMFKLCSNLNTPVVSWRKR